jgi:hypothetical protein
LDPSMALCLPCIDTSHHYCRLPSTRTVGRL